MGVGLQESLSGKSLAPRGAGRLEQLKPRSGCPSAPGGNVCLPGSPRRPDPAKLRLGLRVAMRVRVEVRMRLRVGGEWGID